MTTNNGHNEFSYEDVGLLSLYSFMFVLSVTLFGLMLHTFREYNRFECNLMAPHPIIMCGLCF